MSNLKVEIVASLLLGLAFLAPPVAWSTAPCACPVPASPAGLLRPGQKIVFMGDSITFRGNYTRTVMAFLQSRYPTYNLQFVNAGINGRSAPDVIADMPYVLGLHPDVVTICLGMNDNHYTAFNSTSFTSYTTSIDQIVTQFQNANIKVALVTPGIVDLSTPYQELPGIDAGYNSTLGTYAQWIMNYAAGRGIPAYDLHTLMMNADAAAKTAHPGFCMIPGGIHPDVTGGMLYAYAVLKALGVPASSRSIDLNASSSNLSSSPGLGLGALQSVAGGWSFSFTADPMPYVPPAAAKVVLPYFNFQQDLNTIKLSATGLTATAYDLVIDGYRQGPVSATALSSGINLTDYWTQTPASAAEIHTVQVLDHALNPTGPCYAGTHPQMIDDMESSNVTVTPLVGSVDFSNNSWGGTWDAYAGTVSNTAVPSNPYFLMSGPGHNSGLAARITGTSRSSGYAPKLYTALFTRDQAMGDGIAFWFKANPGTQVQFLARQMTELTPTTRYDDYYHDVPVSGAWSYVQVPFTVGPSGFQHSGPPLAFDPNDIVEVSWLIIHGDAAASDAYDVSIDDLQFYCNGPAPAPPTPGMASPTPTATPQPEVNGVDQVQPVPNPDPNALSVRADGRIEGLRVRVYSKGFQLAYSGVLTQTLVKGWNCVPLPSDWDKGLANDLYFVAVDTPVGGAWKPSPGVQKIYLLK